MNQAIISGHILIENDIVIIKLFGTRPHLKGFKNTIRDIIDSTNTT